MLYFVGVGPGDPELITLRAVRVLQEADAIVLPDSGRDSVVWKIAGKWMEGKPIFRLPMPMKGDKKDWEDAHRRAARQLLDWLEAHEIIAYPVLGDPGIYASSSYLMQQISPHHPCRVIAGVPAMCAIAAQLGIPLCMQGEKLTVIDHLEGEKMPEGSVVIMKAGGRLREISAAAAGREAHAVCNLGMENMQTCSTGALDDLPHSYFTTVIVRDNALR